MSQQEKQKEEPIKTRDVIDKDGKIIAKVDARLLNCYCKACQQSFISYTGIQCPRCGRLQ